MIPVVDHKQLAISRLAVQFRESTNLKGYIEALIEEGDELELVFHQLLLERGIDTAIGAQLDNIGEIVGQSRSIIDGAFVPYFGFEGQPNGNGFNTEPFWNGTDSLVTSGNLNDDDYRLYLKAKIVTNHSSGLHEDFVRVFKILFGEDTGVISEDIPNAKAKIYIIHEFTEEEKLLIISSGKNKILPKPAGVGIEYFEFPSGSPFAFASNPLATGFGTGGFPIAIGE